MASAAAAPRRRGRALAASLALATVLQLAVRPLAFLSIALRRAQPVTRCVGLACLAQATDAELEAVGGHEGPLEVGTWVKAFWDDDVEDGSKWKLAWLSAANEDGTFEVTWYNPRSGPVADVLPPDLIKRVVSFKGYAVGDDCKAISPDDHQFYPGTVAAVLDDDKFRVKWDDPGEGEETADVHADCMIRDVVFRGHERGDAVLAESPEDGVSYPATVVRQNDDGTFQVKWDDADGGPEQDAVSPKKMLVPISELQLNQRRTGVIKSVSERGAIVNIGTADGSRRSEAFLKPERIVNEPCPVDPRDHLTAGQQVVVWIYSILQNDGIELTMLGDQEGVGVDTRVFDLRPFKNIDSDVWLNGEVVSHIDRLGAFVAVRTRGGARANGFVHISKISTDFIENVRRQVPVGMTVQVRVDRIADDKLYLTMLRQGAKPGAPRPGDPRQIAKVFGKFDKSTWISGKVKAIVEFGVFVHLTSREGDKAQGLVHKANIESHEAHMSLKRGQPVKVRIIKVHAGTGKITLSMLPEGVQDVGPTHELDSVAFEAFEGFNPSEWHTGTISRIADSFTLVKIATPDARFSVDGVVERGKEVWTGRTPREGDEVRVRILKVDVPRRRIKLSMEEEKQPDPDVVVVAPPAPVLQVEELQGPFN